MKKAIAVVALLFAGLSNTACVQMPTEQQGTVDMRPRISFQFDLQDEAMADARIILNGQDVGIARDYASGLRALSVRPGSHQLQVVHGTRTLLDERFYLGDGVNRSFLLR